MDSYIDKWNAFMENSYGLSPCEIVLYMRLFQRWNMYHRPEWVSVNNLVLCDLIDVQEKTLIQAKKKLKERNFIDYIPGKRGCKTRYKLLPVESFTVNNTVNREVKEDENDKITSLYTVKNTVNKEAKEQITSLYTVKNTVNTTGLIRDRDREVNNNNISSVFDFYQNNIQTVISPVVYQKLEQDVSDFTEEWVMKAMECAATQSYEKKNINYIHGILENWKQTGLAKPWERKRKKPDESHISHIKRPEYVDEKRKKVSNSADASNGGCPDGKDAPWLAFGKAGTFNGFERQTITG